jgi:NAD(P)-dependent dehydrogenase (short-subunit alcohol dehydrogenase family)
MSVNVKSVFLGSNAFVRQSLKQGSGGAIINIASVGAHRPRPGLVWYNASKGAIANVSAPLPLLSPLGCKKLTSIPT